MAKPSTSSLCLALLILTATRSSEARGVRWEEFDLGSGIWTIPAERMKTRISHRVPISSAACRLLELAKLKALDSPFAFPTSRGTPLSDMALTKLLRDRGHADIATAHGFRSSFKNWCAETGVNDDVSEACLAHSIPDRVKAAYQRTTFEDERRHVMERWGAFLWPAAQQAVAPDHGVAAARG